MLLKKILINQIILCIALFSSSAFSNEKIMLATEDYPPFNMEEKGKIIGISTEILEHAFNKLGIKYTISLYPWIKAYQMAINTKNIAVYSTTRTPERENLFKWVGPLVENNWTFFAKKGSKIRVTSINDAKSYVIGGYQGDAISDFLLKQGFVENKNIDLEKADKLNPLKLEKGNIDLWATGSQIGPWLAKEEKMSGVIPAYTFKKVEMYAAFNKNTDEKIIKKLNEVITQMRKDGNFKSIQNKYK